ncbi:hypothetical protein EDD27_6794 [Nonomuraea polychroma]|uniref:Uncharacterized protein n=1 Tax=Nonomuraea polychroma TaxID=46176 RepID=A0A438ME57_9ACTN|nr:hypothetical protein [Nonomuraea polychroma]RVX44073.1 hypothetical protein EDD27_6794 [Nonomuraea polychroma]
MTRASGEQGKAAPSRPREVTLALVLFLVSAFPQALAIAHFYAVGFASLHLLLYLWFGARAARGRQGSRIGVTITAAVAWIFLAPVI